MTTDTTPERAGDAGAELERLNECCREAMSYSTGREASRAYDEFARALVTAYRAGTIGPIASAPRARPEPGRVVTDEMVERFFREWRKGGPIYKTSDMKIAIRAALTAALAETGNEGWRVPDGYWLVPQAAMDWLFGQGPDDRGHHFGDDPDRGKGAFWWRSTFRRMVSLSTPPSAAPALASTGGEK